ncbi:ATP phosphoribosyltransferase regulatory subunit [Pantoea sp. 1.19]|uniref:ATP phosphoribosyltransferase regulatory subunit n=1 Tax=Pantoea sp. 1.19 TaxID=1925589 RepID=UPI000948AC2F|nr:ATP phosphoribosyltransferase regulatory subunit [Pantoea sp. 1.19]
MARKNRLFIPGMPHLARLSGHNGEALFRQREDYPVFQRFLVQAAQRYGLSLHSWSLAPPRILLLVSAPDKQALSRFIQHLGRRYVPYYNQRYCRHGALWGSRYQCSPLEPEAYFLAVKRFIECGEDGVQGCHSDGDRPDDQIVAHPAWLRLGNSTAQREARFHDFCHLPISPALVAQIRRALQQNCLLATPDLSRKLEERLARLLHTRHSGRPRKVESRPVEQWSWLERQVERSLRQCGYQQIRLALLARAPRFAPGGAAVRGGVALRGDGTSGSLRLLADNPRSPTLSRIWYAGAMFRQPAGEVPMQQDHQIGVEAFGMAGIDIELEQLIMQWAFFQRLGLKGQVVLHLNMLGDTATLSTFRQALRDYYRPLAHLLAPEQRHWLARHPEWLIHHNDILLQRLAARAPRLDDALSSASRQRYCTLQQALDRAGLRWQHDGTLFPRNEYCQLVFEWRSALPGAGQVLSRGGRYDAWASRVLRQPVTACGFALLLEPVMALVSQQPSPGRMPSQVDVVVMPGQPRGAEDALLLGRRLRQQFSQLSIMNDCSRLPAVTRLKNARRRGARFILVIEDDEGSVTLHDTHTQQCQTVSMAAVGERLGQAMAS